MKKAIFLDRDGTINVEKHYLHKISEFEFLPGAIEGLRLLQEAGYLLIIITNQSGIGRGYYEEIDFKKLNSWMVNYLKDADVGISGVYYCPHHPTADVLQYRVDCNCRKPKIGMYEQAAKDFNIDINHSYAIGDKIRDLSICEKSNCKGYLIASNEKSDVIELAKNNGIERVCYAENLLFAARMIVEDIK